MEAERDEMGSSQHLPTLLDCVLASTMTPADFSTSPSNSSRGLTLWNLGVKRDHPRSDYHYRAVWGNSLSDPE